MKRSIEKRHFRNMPQAPDPQWPHHQRKRPGRPKAERETPTPEPTDDIPLQFQVPKAKPRFMDSHRRVTTYFDNQVHAKIRRLREQGQIESVTALVNAALSYYLLQRYGIKT